MDAKRPIVGITMGDPAGNGPEITVQALSSPELYKRCCPIVIGDAKVLSLAASVIGRTDLTIHPVREISQAMFSPGTLDIYDMNLIHMECFSFGHIDPMCGNAAFHYVRKAIDLAMNRQIDATVTNALNKEAMNLALAPLGMHFDGHTEIYAHYTHTKKYTMMLAHGDLRVVHVSTHCSLREACDRVKRARILEVIEIARNACLEIGIPNPRIGVAGLNPHSGENGLFGREELEEIIPAIDDSRARGWNVEGPVPPDTIFPKALGGWYDVVVAMYHDQGHIPLKTVGFVYDREQKHWKAVEGVNITLGLPIIRTSVDHGTGFDQAGKGTSNCLSLTNAIDYAIRMALHKTVCNTQSNEEVLK